MAQTGERGKGFHIGSVWVVVKKEFLDNVRNRWILALSAIFIVFALVMSYFGATQTGGGTGFQDLFETTLGMLSVSIFLVPILGLMLSYGALVGERERGSIQLLLSMPITRLETILGKFIGLASVITASILVGLGIAGLVIMGSVGTEGWREFLTFLGGTVLLALSFLSVGLLLSTFSKRLSTAVGLAVFIWFFMAVIFDLLLTGIHVALGGSFSLLPGQPITFPDWFFVAGMANPVDAFSFFATRVFGITGAFGYSYVMPAFVTVATTAVSMALWAAIPLVVAAWHFQRQDL